MNDYNGRSNSIPNAFNSDGSGNTFDVVIKRNSLGLGFSISGGPDAPSPWTNLIRVKKVFPLQPAWETGLLCAGDVLVKAGGVPLGGLTLRHALDILRTSPSIATLTVFRPYEEQTQELPIQHRLSVVRSYSYTPATQLLQPFNSTDTNENHGLLTAPVKKYGRFSLELTKVNGSLGFTLSKATAEEHSILRHTVKALVKEPALSDGRIQPGDKLISANGIECDNLSHQELIVFLRNCPERVVLHLYRDASRSQTPVSPDVLRRPSSFIKDVEEHPSVSARQKQLRYEAKEMVRSLHASRSSLDHLSPGGSYASVGSGPLNRRGISPHGWKRKNSTLSVSSPLDLDLVESEPMIETPLSPEGNCNESHNSLPQLFLSAQESMGHLTIEELTPTMEEDEREMAEAGESENHMDFLLHSTSPQRPTRLDLYTQNKKKGHRFKTFQ